MRKNGLSNLITILLAGAALLYLLVPVKPLATVGSELHRVEIAAGQPDNLAPQDLRETADTDAILEVLYRYSRGRIPGHTYSYQMHEGDLELSVMTPEQEIFHLHICTVDESFIYDADGNLWEIPESDALYTELYPLLGVE